MSHEEYPPMTDGEKISLGIGCLAGLLLAFVFAAVIALATLRGWAAPGDYCPAGFDQPHLAISADGTWECRP